jgi:molybdopterin-guanine dinucleotide biosynthesis protein A
MELTGIILAGGQSKRMGSDKGLMKFRGKPLVEYAIDLLLPVTDRILISANNREYLGFGFPVVEDIVKGKGPAGGFLSALKASNTGHNLIVSCDMPFLNREAADLLTKNIHNKFNYVPFHKKGIEPLFGVYHKNFCDTIETGLSKGIFKLRSLIDDYPTKYIDFNSLTDKYPDLFRNFNYLSDLD